MYSTIIPKLKQASNLNRFNIFEQLIVCQTSQQVYRLFAVDPYEFIKSIYDLIKFQVINEMQFVSIDEKKKVIAQIDTRR